MDGFTLDGLVERVTDGDTVRVQVGELLFKTRVLGLDTEESIAGSAKPVTPWGKAASAFAASVLPPGTPVTLEFPGRDPAVVDGAINVNYLDNYERPLAHVHLHREVDGSRDLSELMIRRGYSPYFTKYGRAMFPDRDRAYAAAERAAQADDVGVWNQLAANGVLRPEDAPRNYARLTVWWELRARVIDGFRAARAARPEAALLDTRLDYATLVEAAREGREVTVFMEMTEGSTVGGLHYVIRSGSMAQPLRVFMPDEDRAEVRRLKRLLANRYVASGEDFPRFNYAYLTGPLSLYDGKPQIVVESITQVSDEPPG